MSFIHWKLALSLLFSVKILLLHCKWFRLLTQVFVSVLMPLKREENTVFGEQFLCVCFFFFFFDAFEKRGKH